MRYKITVDRSLLDSDPSNPNVIRVEDTKTGEVTHHAKVRMFERMAGAPTVMFGPQQPDGARVWIEAELVEVED